MNHLAGKIIATVNVVAGVVLLVWFNTIPPESTMAPFVVEQAESCVFEAIEVGDAARAELPMDLMRGVFDSQQRRIRQYRYWCGAAGVLVFANALVWLFLLAVAERYEYVPGDEDGERLDNDKETC